MTWWQQIVSLLMVVPCYMLLQGLYRRQDGMQASFLISILLALAALFVPDIIILLPIVWGAFITLRASNLRVYSASLIGLAVVGIYLALGWFLQPESVCITYLQSMWLALPNRGVCWLILPEWLLISTGVLVTLGLWAQVAHFRRYQTANVRIQTYVLLATPLYWTALLSCLFPTISGSCMLAVLWAVSLLYPVLYVTTYGMPQLPSIERSNPYRRSYKRRSRDRRRR